MYAITTATRKVARMTKRIRAIQGGTSASKTISVLIVLIDLAQQDKSPTLTSVVSESFPHLKRGAIKDFLDIMTQQGYFKPGSWNKTDFVYTFETGSKLEFFSADQSDKVRGPRRDRLFMNEANNIAFDTFDQLEVRTNELIFLDWNPTTEFWFYTEIEGREDVEHITLTYLDNEALPDAIRQTIERRKHRKGWWRVFGEGQLGEVEGKIYSGWRIVDEVPYEAKLLRYWLDFGYSVDPTSLGGLYSYNGGFIVDQIAYRKGMLNKQIADLILSQESPNTLVVADSSEPKSIDEIAGYGVTIIGAEKGPDSVNNGIQVVQGQRISMTKRSVDVIKEYRNYLWLVDKNGKVLPVPEDGFNHAMDGIRYAITNVVRIETGDDEQERADRLMKRLKNAKTQTR